MEMELKPEQGGMMVRVYIRFRVPTIKDSVPALPLQKLVPVVISPGSVYPSIA